MTMCVALSIHKPPRTPDERGSRPPLLRTTALHDTLFSTFVCSVSDLTLFRGEQSRKTCVWHRKYLLCRDTCVKTIKITVQLVSAGQVWMTRSLTPHSL